jgi:signal transduction histidine kinase/CheY-like chemotaxis protein
MKHQRSFRLDSLRLRVCALVLVALVPAAGFGVLNEFVHRQALSRDVQADAEQGAVLLSAQIASQVSGIEQTLSVLSRAPDVIRGNADACNRYVHKLKFAFNGPSEIGVADLSGKVFCLSREINGINIADRLYFQEAIASRKLSVGEFAIGKAAGAKAIQFGYPVHAADGSVSGVAFIPLNLAWLADRLARTPLPERSSITVADRNGTVLVRNPQKDWVGTRLPPQWLSLLHASASGTATLTDLEGRRSFVGYVPVGSGPQGLFVAVGLAEEVVMAPAVAAGNRAMALIGLSVILALALSWVINELLVHKPLLSLTGAAEDLKGGNLSARVPIGRGMVPELETLGLTFNELATTLQEDDGARRLAQTTMQEARDLAEAASRSKTTFLAALGHDLRQPLHSISLSAALLTMRLAGQPEALLALRMQRSISRLGELVNAVLDVSQLDAGLAKARVHDFCLDALLQGITDDFSDTAAAKGISLLVPACTYWVRSDVRLLRRITENLVGNAVKYTPSGGVIGVSCERVGSEIHLAVADNGPGIPADEQAHIWDEFWQLGNLEREHSKGLGLGLAIVRRMCALLGHQVRCESVPGRGSTFTVTLPAVVGQAVAPIPIDAPALDGTVLLVDDDPAIVVSTTEMLQAWGLTVVACASAEDALVRMADPDASFDALISDYHLPGQSGLEVIAAARRRFPSLLCVLVTGEVGSRLTGQVPPDVLMLFKPVSTPALAAGLRSLDKKPQLHA